MSVASEEKHVMLIGPMHPYRGGIAHFSETMYRGLYRRGYQVSGVTFTRQYPELLFPGKTQYVEEEKPSPVFARRLLDSLNPFTWIKTAYHITRCAPDLVVFNYWMPFFAPAFGTIAWYLRWRGIRVISVVHNALPHERRPGDKMLSRFFLRACDGLIVMSDAVREDVKELAAGVPVQQIHHPVYDTFGDPLPREEARRRLNLPSEDPILLFFGFIRRYKGLHVLLKALPDIVADRPDLRVVIVGECYEDPTFYEKLIERNQLERYVDWQDRYIPDREVGLYFSAADLVVQPYVSATQSGVAQIAYHFERPLIVTDVGGLPEVVPHEQAGFIVPPEDPDALAAAVRRFFAEGWQDRLQEGIREEKKKYSWDRLYEAVEALMESRTT